MAEDTFTPGEDFELSLGDEVVPLLPAGELTDAAWAERGPVVSVAAGDGHAVLLCADGSVFTWGVARQGQLGLTDGLHEGEGGEERAREPVVAPTRVNRLPSAVAVAAGDFHTLFLSDRNCLYGTGDNLHGQVQQLRYDAGVTVSKHKGTSLLTILPLPLTMTLDHRHYRRRRRRRHHRRRRRHHCRHHRHHHRHHYSLASACLAIQTSTNRSRQAEQAPCFPGVCRHVCCRVAERSVWYRRVVGVRSL